MYLRLYLKQPFFRRVKIDQDRMRCDVESSEVFHIIDSINIPLGPNWQQSTIKMVWHGWGVMEKVRKCFISLILSYKIRKNTAFLRCTANQSVTDHKLHFQPKHPAGAKLTAINSNNGCGTADV